MWEFGWVNQIWIISIKNQSWIQSIRLFYRLLVLGISQSNIKAIVLTEFFLNYHALVKYELYVTRNKIQFILITIPSPTVCQTWTPYKISSNQRRRNWTGWTKRSKWNCPGTGLILTSTFRPYSITMRYGCSS